MSVTTWLLAAGVALAVGAPAAESEPSDAARAAMATLAQPSVAGPLPGSLSLEPGTYRVEGGCPEALQRYLAPEAPVPAGASVTQAGSSVVVTLPYAESGVLFTPGQGYCQYRIVAGPTLSVEGTLPQLPSGRYYTRVLCTDDTDPERTVAAELATPGGSLLLSLTTSGIGLGPGSFAAAGPEDAPPPLPLPTNVRSFVGKEFVYDVGSPGAGAVVSGTCTGSVFEILAGS